MADKQYQEYVFNADNNNQYQDQQIFLLQHINKELNKQNELLKTIKNIFMFFFVSSIVGAIIIFFTWIATNN